MTKTSSFGTSKREGHDASSFYSRKMLVGMLSEKANRIPSLVNLEGWVDQIYCMDQPPFPIPDESVALAFTSPPYNCGKDYDLNMTMDDYLEFIQDFGREVYRTLIPGGKYVINVANLGRKPYIPMTACFYQVHMAIGFLPQGEIIWQKGRGASGNCAWGSWLSAKAPNIRDIHEYLLIFAKESYARLDKGESDITRDEFLQATISIWEIRAALAKQIGHPAPFPLELAERVIKLFSYKGDVILDPFVGSGTTCVAAKKLGRHYVGVEKVQAYCDLAESRLISAGDKK